MFNDLSIDCSSCQMPREPFASFFKPYPCFKYALNFSRLYGSCLVTLTYGSFELLWIHIVFKCLYERDKWVTTWQNQQNECAPSEDSDQPGHPPSLIRVIAVRMKKPWVLSYQLSAQRRLWSDWVEAQADLSLRWALSHFVGFVMSWLKWHQTAHVMVDFLGKGVSYGSLAPSQFLYSSDIKRFTYWRWNYPIFWKIWQI